MRWLLIVLATQSISACTLYSSERQTHFADAEGRVPQQLFNRLEQQSVSKPWVLKQLGQPMAITPLGQGAQVYTWSLTRRDVNERSIFLLYKNQHTKTQQSFLHLAFGGDELLKHWLDRDALVDTKVLLNSRDLQSLSLGEMEKTAYIPPERPVITQITPGPSAK
ncbi:MAG TPA: hypothetical protein VIZ65_04125 [Cellvibrionaceae bacterium]